MDRLDMKFVEVCSGCGCQCSVQGRMQRLMTDARSNLLQAVQ